MGWWIPLKVNSIDKGCLWIIILVYLYYITNRINILNVGKCTWLKITWWYSKKWFEWREKERWRRAYQIQFKFWRNQK